MKLPLLGAGLLVALLFLLPVSSVAQVWTHVLGQNGTLTDYLPWAPDQLPVAQLLPAVDVAQAIREDERTGNPRNRFGLEIALDLDEQDGTWQETGTAWPIWVMKIRSAGATSLSFVFRDVYLPKNAEMYLFAPTGFMVMGPIRAEHVHGGVYASDLIYGEEVVLAVRMRSSESETFRLRVEKAIHGYSGRGSRDYGDAAACNIDVNCAPFGNGWELERDAVGLIISGGNEWCSGTLINTACPSLKSFFLTAFHCLDVLTPNGALSVDEQELPFDWVFRFNYDGVQPNTPMTCRGPEPSSWLSFSGATLRASWFESDMALLELSGSVINQPTLALAGWTTDFEATTNSIQGPLTAIHHPRGDVKMITIDEDEVLATTINSPVAPANHSVWRVDGWELGTVENRSSGGAIFNQLHRIVGQLVGSETNVAICDNEADSFFGRFDLSWTGGGTTNSRLSDWLGNDDGVAINANSIRVPSIDYFKPNIICSDGKEFSLVSPIPGASITWSTSPSEAFENPSGSGTTAFLNPPVNSVGGWATLTFSMNFTNGCSPVLMSQTVWVGPPQKPQFETNPIGNPVVVLEVGEPMTVTVTDFSGAAPADIIWKATGNVDFSVPPSGIHANLEGLAVGAGDIRIETFNACSTSVSALIPVLVEGPEESASLFSLYPNPSQGEVTLTALWPEAATQAAQVEWQDLTGRIYLKHSTDGISTPVDLSAFPNGMYLVRLHLNGQVFTQSFILQQ